MNFGRNTRGTNKNPRATANTICQKCLQHGHFIYECKSTQPYKPRPSRSQMLEKPELARNKRDKPSVEVPEEFKKRSGVANKILEEKEKDREAKRKRSASASSSSSSDSESDSGTDSSDSDSDSDSSGSDSDSSRSSKKHKRVRRTRSASPDESTKGKGKARSASVDSRGSR